MLTLILEFFTSLAKDLLVDAFALFAGVIDFDLGQFVVDFPVAKTFYGMFQAIGVGLVLAIAIIQIMKFYVGPLARTTEHPTTIAIRAFFAIFLIFFGNYILNFVFDITRGIFIDFAAISSEATVSIGEIMEGVGNNFVDRFGTIAVEGIVGGITFSAGAALFITLIALTCIIVQFIKMMLEIIERYIMLCLLIFSSPLAWATMTSDASSKNKKKWISMFIAQCVLMILSIWGTVMFFDVLGNPAISPFKSLIYAYGLIKIIKRMDNYLQQLNLNAAGMGGASILDSLAATAGGLMMAKNKLSGGKGGNAGVASRFLDPKRSSPVAQAFIGGVAGYKNARESGSGRGSSAWKGVVSGLKNGGEASVSINPSKRPGTINEAQATQRMNDQARMLNKSVKDGTVTSHGLANAIRTGEALKNSASSGVYEKYQKTVASALDRNPNLAKDTMSELAASGGAELSGDVASSMWAGYVGQNAFDDKFDGENITGASLSIGEPLSSDGGRNEYAASFAARTVDSDGAVHLSGWTNAYGKLAEVTEVTDHSGDTPVRTIQSTPIPRAKEVMTSRGDTTYYSRGKLPEQPPAVDRNPSPPTNHQRTQSSPVYHSTPASSAPTYQKSGPTQRSGGGPAPRKDSSARQKKGTEKEF